MYIKRGSRNYSKAKGVEETQEGRGEVKFLDYITCLNMKSNKYISFIAVSLFVSFVFGLIRHIS